MSHEIEVRLLFPNFGKETGETVFIDSDEARLWLQRRLVERVVDDVELPQSADAR